MNEQRETLKPNETHHCLLCILASSRDDVIVHDPIEIAALRDVRRADIMALLTERAQLLEVACEARLLVRKSCGFLAEEAGGLRDPDVLNAQLYLMQLKLDTLDGVERTFEEFYAEFIKQRAEVSA